MRYTFPLRCHQLGSFVIPQFGGKDGLLNGLDRPAIEVYSPVDGVQQFEPSDTYYATWVCHDCHCDTWGVLGMQRGCQTCGNGAPKVTEHSTSRGYDFEIAEPTLSASVRASDLPPPVSDNPLP